MARKFDGNLPMKKIWRLQKTEQMGSEIAILKAPAGNRINWQTHISRGLRGRTFLLSCRTWQEFVWACPAHGAAAINVSYIHTAAKNAFDTKISNYSYWVRYPPRHPRVTLETPSRYPRDTLALTIMVYVWWEESSRKACEKVDVAVGYSECKRRGSDTVTSRNKKTRQLTRFRMSDT